jgi:hypothetical protein
MDCLCGMPECRRPPLRVGTASNGTIVTWTQESVQTAFVEKICSIQLKIAWLKYDLDHMIKSDGLFRCPDCKTCSGAKNGCVYCCHWVSNREQRADDLHSDKRYYKRKLQTSIDMTILRSGTVFIN